MLLTDDKKLVTVAERNYHLFKVPTNMVESRKAKRYYTAEQKADLDIKTSTNKIGDIINLAQELQTLMWHRLNNGETYKDIEDLYFDICQLSVLSGAEIDRAKKEFLINSTAEIKKLKTKWERKDEDSRIIKPYFFGFLAKEKGYYNKDRKNYYHHDTSMDYLHEIMNSYRSPVIKSDPMDLYNIFDFEDYNSNSRKVNYVTEVVDMIREFQSYSLRLWKFTDKPGNEKYEEYTQKKGELLSEINKRTYNPSTLLYLFRRLNEDKTLRPYIITILFNIGNQDAFDLIKRSKQQISLLEEDENGDIDLYGVHYRKKTQKIQEDGINEDIDNEENCNE